MNREEVEEVIKDTIEYANGEIKKNKIRLIKKFILIFLILILLITVYMLTFEYEIPVKYSKEIVEISIPEDKGLDIRINLDNFKNTNAVLVKIDENNYDLYISVTETAATKIFNDSDKSNNLLRVANNVVVDLQSGKLRGYIPNENNVESIRKIYYIDNLSNRTMCLNDTELINYKNKTLIWERDILL